MQINQANNAKAHQATNALFAEISTAGKRLIPCLLSLLSLSSQIAALGAPAPAQPAAGPPSAAQLTKILDSSGVLQKGYRCSVTLDKNTATVTSYQNLTSKNPDSDCKIDAVLLAKKVFDSCAGLARVKVKLLDPRSAGNSKSITVTVGDISAYSSGKITMQALMSSLEIISSRDMPASAATTQSANKPASLTKDSNVYRNLKAALTIHYPNNWMLKEHPDTQTDASIGGFYKNGQLGDLRLCVSDANPHMSIEHYGKTLTGALAGSINSFKVLEESQVLFANHRNLSGWKQICSFEMNGITVIQQHIFFANAGKYCWLSLTSPGWNLQDAKECFSDLLSTIETP